ncbi:MAG: phosphoribosylanthranilate isomerase [Anaerolinea sp.]|nr:phosphoribosylanthranilate isomerase [Anaerolinea sp.]
MTIVKICGITTLDDARMAAEAGADMLGFNFFKRSARYIEPAAARTLCVALRAELGAECPLLVGVFVNDLVSRVSLTMEQVGLNFAQLSGDESFEMLRELRGIAFKAIRPRNTAEALEDTRYYGQFALTDPRIPSILLDAYKAGEYGGTGEQAADAIALEVKAATPRLMLAGGLTPDNVAARIAAVQPWGVDVASGVEGDQPGRKDPAKVKAFIEAAMEVD